MILPFMRHAAEFERALSEVQALLGESKAQRSDRRRLMRAAGRLSRRTVLSPQESLRMLADRRRR